MQPRSRRDGREVASRGCVGAAPLAAAGHRCPFEITRRGRRQALAEGAEARVSLGLGHGRRAALMLRCARKRGAWMRTLTAAECHPAREETSIAAARIAAGRRQSHGPLSKTQSLKRATHGKVFL